MGDNLCTRFCAYLFLLYYVGTLRLHRRGVLPGGHFRTDFWGKKQNTPRTKSDCALRVQSPQVCCGGGVHRGCSSRALLLACNAVRVKKAKQRKLRQAWRAVLAGLLLIAAARAGLGAVRAAGGMIFVPVPLVGYFRADVPWLYRIL